MKEPRPYQLDLERRLLEAWARGMRRLLLQLPTGGGKTRCAGLLVNSAVHNRRPVLFAAHREELITQAKRAFIEDCGVPEQEIGIILSGWQERRSALVQIGSVQTLAKRQLPPADLLFIDEAHRIGSQYQRLFDHYEEKTIIGMTATPERLSGEPLRDHYDEMIQGPKPSELVAMGFLSDPEVWSKEAPSLEDVGVADGDFEEASLEGEMMSPRLVGQIVPHYELRGGGHRAFVFAVTVRHAQQIAYAFQARGHAAAVLSGETGRAERREMLEAFARGDVRILVSVGVLLEGVDCPAAKVAIWARPTMSVTVYLQGTGRILRPWGGITPVLLDHAGNVERLGMPLKDRPWSLDGFAKKGGGEGLTKDCPSCGKEAACGKRVCDGCGNVFSEKAGEPIEGEEQLVRHVTLTPEDEYRQTFVRHWAMAKKRGYKPGYVYVQVTKETGKAPPKEWLDAVAKDSVRDVGWKKAIALRYVIMKKMKKGKKS